MTNNALDEPGWDEATSVSPPEDAPPDARLAIEGRTGFETLRGAGPWLLGRGAEADVSFPGDPTCSREQARIARASDGFALEAVSGRVPTTLNGKAVTGTVPLADGARIAFGFQRIVFLPLQTDFAEGTLIGRSSDIAPSPDRLPPDRLPLDRDLSIGRQDLPGQTVFDHPAVSRRHAAFAVAGNGVIVRDLGSTNGTFVNGARIDWPRQLAPGDRIDIGPFQLTFDGQGLTSLRRTGNAELLVSDVSFDVRAGGLGREPMRILDGASLRIRPHEFVCIVGASGSGKSTLMNILAGRVRPSTGTVLLNGTNLHDSFEALKQDVAFVPQQDVLHEQLTLRQALDYAARLRLPSDTSAAQRLSIVETAARSVDLLERLDTRIGSLSGGQKKRASLASEILNRPSLLFLDEVTSGLDESTDWEIMRLLRRLADEGMTIVVVTHTLANVESFCHKIICLGRGGHVTFAGPPDDALAFFDVRRLGEIFNRIEDLGAPAWRKRHEDLVATPASAMEPAVPAAASAPPVRPREGVVRQARRTARQLGILTHRNTRLLVSDRRTLIMAAVQSCLIGGLMGYAFGTFGVGQEAVNGKNALLFLLGLTSIWLGCNGASKDIVGELVIYRRERDINLSTAAFVVSKYLVTSLFTMLQLVVVFALTALLAERIPGNALSQLAILMEGVLAGTAIGLTISAFSNTRDQATTIVPMALVPQIILAGILVPRLPAPAEVFAKLAVSSFWLTESLKAMFIAAEGPIRVISAKTGALVNMTSQSAGLGMLAVGLHAAVFLLVTYLAMLFRHGNRGRAGH